MYIYAYFAMNYRYYDLPKYWSFFLTHPVYLLFYLIHNRVVIKTPDEVKDKKLVQLSKSHEYHKITGSAGCAGAYKAVKFDFRFSWHQIVAPWRERTISLRRWGWGEGVVQRDGTIQCLHSSNLTSTLPAWSGLQVKAGRFVKSRGVCREGEIYGFTFFLSNKAVRYHFRNRKYNLLKSGEVYTVQTTRDREPAGSIFALGYQESQFLSPWKSEDPHLNENMFP
jgi:hypothetical protein